MARPKKDAPVEGAAVADAPSGEEAGGTKKAAGRGKRKVPTDAPATKRMLRSNSKPTLEVPPIAKKEVKPTKASKPAEKGKKVAEAETNGVTNGNGETDAAVEKTKVVTSKKATTDKAPKGKKKAAAANGKPPVVEDEVEKEEPTEAKIDTETEKSKPVKSGGGKKKATKAEEPAASEPESVSQDKEIAAPGRGKKKAEKVKEEEIVAPKKAKKEAKSSKTEPKETEEASKPAPAEAKKGKGKAAKAATEVAIEHWNAERVKDILQPFCSPSVAFSVNKKAPRRGAFEIVLINQNGQEEVLWSGIKRGPPRKEKFPSDDEVKELAERFFSTPN